MSSGVGVMEERYGYILTIEEKYWNRFCKLNKAGKSVHAHVLGGSFLSENVKLLFFYSILPFKEILGFADYIERIVDHPQKLWKSHGNETCLGSFGEFEKLTHGKETVTCIRFTNLHEASNILSFDQISDFLNTERMSQTGMYVSKQQAEILVKLLKTERNV